MKTHTRLAREELNEGLGHLRLAAAHAADGASGALAPRVESARKAVQPGLAKARTATMDSVDTLFTAAIEGSRKASKRATKDAKKMARKGKKQVQMRSGKQRRWPKVLGGLAVAGAVAGTAAAYMKRPQANNAWDEDDATRTTSDAHAVQ